MDYAAAVARVPFLRAVPEAERVRLAPRVRMRRLERGDAIWTQGDPCGEFVFLGDGRAKLVKANEAGRECIVDVCGPGELLCANVACPAAPYCCTSIVTETSVAIVVPRTVLLDLLDRSPAASRAFLRAVAQRGQGLTHRIEQLSSGQVDRRIASLFLRLADTIGEPADGGLWIPVALSRQDLADLCGTTMETTIRVMSRLAREGVLRTVGRGFQVPDRARLEALGRGD